MDALSRHPVMMMESIHDIIPKTRKAQDNNEIIKSIKKQLENGPY